MNNITSENLKQLKIFESIRKDPLFGRFMQVCRNDTTYSEIKSKQKIDFAIPAGFLYYIGNIIPIFLLMVAIYFIRGTDFFYEYVVKTIFFASIFISGAISLFAGLLTLFLGAVANVFVLYLTYSAIFAHNMEFYSSITNCMILLFLVNLINNTIYNIKEKRKYLKAVKNDKENKNQVNEFEKYYNDTIEQADSRRFYCKSELWKRGEAWDKDLTRTWWNAENIEPLKKADGLFEKKHIAGTRQVLEWDQSGYNRGPDIHEKHVFEYFYDKKYFLTKVPRCENKEIIAAVSKSYKCEWDALVPVSFNAAECDKYEILAFGSKTIISNSYNANIITRQSPTQEQINEQYDAINRKYDDRERMVNAYIRDVPLTIDELTLASGGKATSLDEQMYSANVRRNALDKYISQNTFIDSSSKTSDGSREETEIFVYIIDGYIFTKSPKYLRTFPRKEDEETKRIKDENFIETREEEIEAFLDFYVSSNPALALELADKIWLTPLNKQNRIIASKIMHTIANNENLKS